MSNAKFDIDLVNSNKKEGDARYKIDFSKKEKLSIIIKPTTEYKNTPEQIKFYFSESTNKTKGTKLFDVSSNRKEIEKDGSNYTFTKITDRKFDLYTIKVIGGKIPKLEIEFDNGLKKAGCIYAFFEHDDFVVSKKIEIINTATDGDRESLSDALDIYWEHPTYETRPGIEKIKRLSIHEEMPIYTDEKG